MQVLAAGSGAAVEMGGEGGFARCHRAGCCGVRLAAMRCGAEVVAEEWVFDEAAARAGRGARWMVSSQKTRGC